MVLKKTKNKKSKSKLLASLLIISLVIFIIFYIKVCLPVQKYSTDFQDAEKAIVTKNTLLAFSFNFYQFNFLDKVFFGVPDLVKSEIFFKKNNSFLRMFSDGGVNLVDNVKSVVGSVKEGAFGLTESVVLVGKFQPLKIIKILQGRFLLKEEKFKDFVYWTYQESSKATCKSEKNHSLWISDRFILWTNTSNIENVLGRIVEDGDADDNVDSWKKYREQKIFAAMLSIPRKKIKTAGEEETNSIQYIDKKLKGVKKIYLGLNIEWLHLMGGLSFLVEHDNGENALKLTRSWKESVEDVDALWRTDFPQLSKFLNKTSFNEEKNILNVNAEINKENFSLMRDIYVEIVPPFLSLVMPPVDNATKGDLLDAVDKNPSRFKMNLVIDDLPKFNSNGTFFGKDLPHSSGPFGFTIKNIRLRKTDQEEQLLEVEYVGVGIPNIENRELVNMYFKEAVDINGVNRLSSDNKCETDRTTEDLHPSQINTYNGINSFKGNYTIGFNSGFKVSDLKLIKGEAIINLPVIVEEKLIKVRLNNKMETDSFSLIISNIRRNTVSLKIYGDDSSILAIKGFNDENKGLVSNSSANVEIFFGEGKLRVIDFKGRVDMLKVYTSKASKKFNVPFEIIPSIQVVDSDKRQVKYDEFADSKMFEEVTKEGFEKKFSKMVDGALVWNPLSPSLESYIKEKETINHSSNIPNVDTLPKSFTTGPFTLFWESGKKDNNKIFEIFSNELSNSRGVDALELLILKIEMLDGRSLVPPPDMGSDTTPIFWREKGSMNLGTYQTNSENNTFLKFMTPPYHFTYSHLPDNLNVNDIKMIKGMIRYHVVPKMQMREIINPKLGSNVLENDKEVLKLIEISGYSFTYSYGGKLGKLLGVQNFDINNRELERLTFATSANQPGEFHFYRQQATVKTQFYFVEKGEYLEYPFELVY